MIIKATFGRFEQEFENSGRGGSWTSDGLRALYDYLEENESDDYEVDATAIDCEFAEYRTAREACEDIGIDFDIAYEEDEDGEDTETEIEDDTEANALDALKRTPSISSVIEFDGGVIVRE